MKWDKAGNRKIHNCATQVTPLDREDPMLRPEAGVGVRPGKEGLACGREPRALALTAKSSVGISHYSEQKGRIPTDLGSLKSKFMGKIKKKKRCVWLAKGQDTGVHTVFLCWSIFIIILVGVTMETHSGCVSKDVSRKP